VSEQAEGKAKEDTHASGAKPKPEGPVREHGWRPTRVRFGTVAARQEAVRRRAIEGGRRRGDTPNVERLEAAV